MSIEAMKIMNLVAPFSDFDQIMRHIVLSNHMQLIDAYEQIQKSQFTLEMATDHLDEIVDMSNISVYKRQKNLEDLEKKLHQIIKYMDQDFSFQAKHIPIDYDFEQVKNTINQVYKAFERDTQLIQNLENKKNKLIEMSCAKNLEHIDIHLRDLYSLDFFEVKFGKMSKKNRQRLSLNYENVPAAVMHLETPYSDEYYLVVTPKSLINETERILKSVYFEEVNFDQEYLDVPKRMMEFINKELTTVNKKIKEATLRINQLKEDYMKILEGCYSKLMLEIKIYELSEKIASTNHFFYLSAWIPESKIESITRLLETNKNQIIIDYKSAKDSQLPTPTSLKNNWISKPFESLVNMYGVPNYNELDPTVFFSITYMILFGAMFGDLGQGLVFFLSGFYIKRKHKVFGELLSRVGISSMFFGFIYDSLFGYEHVISELIPLNIYVRPIENINTMLTVAVALGVFLLYIGFSYSIVNKMKVKDIKEGIFGRNGVTGLVLYTALLLIAANTLIDNFSFNPQVLYGISIICVILLILKEPITNKILKEDYLYSEPIGEYYVESGFELIETFLSMLSNTVSFIRVGAFALNHVGLFVAFQTMARLIGTNAGNISMFILGNLLIIFLEGLIVFIQGLRLMYYEVFSKYYSGDGYAFKPSGLE